LFTVAEVLQRRGRPLLAWAIDGHRAEINQESTSIWIDKVLRTAVGELLRAQREGAIPDAPWVENLIRALEGSHKVTIDVTMDRFPQIVTMLQATSKPC
jgi:hypothetical protein